MNSTAVSNSTFFSRIHATRRIAAACGVGVLLLGTSACGSDDPAPAVQNATTNEGGTEDGGPPASQAGSLSPGADGKIAAVADNTAQVQSVSSGQVAVSWTSSTTFTKQVSAELADLDVGDCVVVTSEATQSDEDATTPQVQATAVTAASVRISEPLDGTCIPTDGLGGGPGGGGPQFQGGGPDGGTGASQPPAGGLDGAPPGGEQLRRIDGAFGTVTSVDATGFVVESTRPAMGDSAAETTTVTVTVAGTTTYTTTAKASAADVKVGQCLRADGEADDTGAVSATRIAITPPTDGECAGFVRRVNGSGPGTDTSQAS